MSASETLVVETAARVLADLADPQTIVLKRDDAWKVPLWSSLQEIGLDLAWVSEAAGGAGASLADGFGIIREAGRAALAVPLAETLLAGWLLDRAGLTAPGGSITVAPVRPKDHLILDKAGRISGRARMVPFASDVEHIVVLATADDGAAVALVRSADCKLKAGKSLAGDARDAVEFTNVLPVHSARVKGSGAREKDVLLLMGAAARQQGGGREAGREGDRRQVAQLHTLRRMSVSVAGMLEAGREPVVEAAIVKDLGTVWEQGLPHRVRELASLLDLEDDEEDAFRNELDFELKIAPKLTIQGGTTEVLRGVIARGLGLR